MTTAADAGPADEAGLLKVGARTPQFDLAVVNPDGSDARVSAAIFQGTWLVLLFYPRDFSFVCPTELRSFSGRLEDFRIRGCEILAVSVDTPRMHREWLAAPVDSGGVGPLRFPLASDVDGAVARRYGVWDDGRKVAGRGLFIVDPGGVLQYQVVHNMNVGRSAEETLRVLDALQTHKLCPASWVLGDGTIDPAARIGEGTVLANYRIDKKLGGGTFGQVYGATDLWLNRSVALKVLAPGVTVDWSKVLSEARTAASVSHPNICGIHAVHGDDGVPFIVMEFVPGITLHGRLKGEPMTDEEIRSVACQVATGLGVTHAGGIVHGDLKPANIMMGSDGTTKILDFGLSFATGVDLPDVSTAGEEPGSDGADPESFDGRITQPFLGKGRAVKMRGTPGYIAPETAQGTPVSQDSDVFVFGLILWEMLTGRRMIEAKSLRDTVKALRKTDLPARVLEAPEPYRELLGRLLDRDPGGRPAMDEVRRWFEERSTGSGGGPPAKESRGVASNPG